MFGFEGETPACLMELVEGDGLLSHLQREEGAREASYVPVSPREVGAFERFATPKREGRSDSLRVAVCIISGQQVVKLAEVDV
jgi:hypothetical protein